MSSETSSKSQPEDGTRLEVDTLVQTDRREFVLATDNTPQADSLGEGWITLSRAAELLGESADRLRRKLKSGDIPGQLVFDPDIGRERWMVNTSMLSVRAPDLGVVPDLDVVPDPGDADPGVLVPMEAIDRLEEAWARLRDAVARAEVAERRVDFEKQRRQHAEQRLQDAEQDRDRLRQMLKAENEIAERVVELESQKRQELEQERDRLRSVLEAEQSRKTRWRKWME